MKSLYLYIILLLLTCAACKDGALAPKEELPPATQEGKNTFGCLVNGEVWVPKAFLGNELTYYYHENILNIAAYRKMGSKDINQSLGIRIEDCNNIGNYKLTTIELARGRFSDLNKACLYQTDNRQIGALRVTKLDTINHIIAGTFEFTVWTEECDTIRVTDGRFDIKYRQ